MPKITATTPSKKKVSSSVATSVRLTPPSKIGRPSAAVAYRERSFTRPVSSMPVSEVMLMMPRPPAWISASTMNCPARLQWLPVSSVTRPVKVVADVAVNSALISAVGAPSAEANGMESSAVPVRIRARKPSAVSCAGPSHLLEAVSFTGQTLLRGAQLGYVFC